MLRYERKFTMKKYFALIISLVVILTCFTACKPKLKGGALVTNAGGDVYAAVTNADGGLERDEAGNLVVLVTDQSGKNVKGEDGEYQTNVVAQEHAIIIDRVVEWKDYTVRIPNGWSDAYSLNGLSISKDGSADSLVIETKDGELSQVVATAKQAVDIVANYVSGAETKNEAIKVGDYDAQFLSVFLADNGKGNSTYLGYICLEINGKVYSCRIASDRNMNDDLGEIQSIISSISFR